MRVRGQDKEQTMRWIVAALLAAAAFAVFPATSEARDGCGRGWYFDGVACRPQAAAPRYAPGYGYGPYRRPGARTWQGCPPGQVPTGRGDCRPWYPTRGSECPPGYTLQSGRCKPYRGY